MSDQYVFELSFQWQGRCCDDKESQFVIIDGSSMADFHRLKEDLGMCMPEPFSVQYIDDEEDVITIDTEDEFKEFAKIAKIRSSRGMMMRLILNGNGQVTPSDKMKLPQQLPSSQRHPEKDFSPPDNNQSLHNFQGLISISKLKDHIKTELKKEIMSELKLSEAGAQASGVSVNANVFGRPSSYKTSLMDVEPKETQNEEDFAFLLSPSEKKKTKLMHNSHKKLEKKEKLLESMIDQRLEKLEMKKKKLMDKYNKLPGGPVFTRNISLPRIASVIATKETSELTKPVPASESFTHTWTIINDGTVPLNNVELRHTWSTPGLEPEEPVLKLAPLLPSRMSTIEATFNTSRVHGSFVSYWQFFRQVNDRWLEFGHYVSLKGTVKHVKPEEDKGRKMKEAKQMKKKFGIEEARESKVTLKRQMAQLQATLASSEIAAEMADKAARLLARAAAAAEENAATAGPSQANKLNGPGCQLEAAAAGIQQLNLMDTECESDATLDVGEVTDRGFVLVNMKEPNDGAKRKIRDDENPVTGSAQEATAQPEPAPVPSYNYTLYPPIPAPAPPVFVPNNVFGVFPPPMYGIPPAPLPLATQPPFIPISGPPTFIMANHNENDFQPPQNVQPENVSTEAPAQNMMPAEDPAKTEARSSVESAPVVAEVPQPSAAPQQEQSNPAQILPPGLVDGAINVAATAYSTAWSAINNLRPKTIEVEFDPVFENNMAMLVEMGFNNLGRNARLLKRFDNDISQVIGVICSTGGGHDLDID